ncbi:DNA cytosine methyltransferase [Streptantibioticus silvisoli]|jgi:DNA (cytosine-5)-methyltransferase 1|uniref:Cytosine-specific methyltransferase n=1 Tax=Streptantibioticus silvisoli TaxID=2705255 RepID=A0ABT6VUF3_9ACTN|nr:DNA (cytosine-5-)-methyltransferase [Streptantibioticus silvisoli]MDI5962108.1 DNA (cytosine-5-)-methyltransferase [Streptantibioticus silvisoli]
MSDTAPEFISVEICAGAGGQAVGLHRAGFRHLALVEIDENAIATLRTNVKKHGWQDCTVLPRDVKKFTANELQLEAGRLDLLAGGVPCPPFSLAGKQLGRDDERDLFPDMLRLVEKLRPKAVMIENVRGLLQPPEKFQDYRESEIESRLVRAGYERCMWDVLEAGDYGVPQLRPRAILVAMKTEYARFFKPPVPLAGSRITVGAALWRSMRERFSRSGAPDWEARYDEWLELANKSIAPTLVGGSKKHGGADLGPTRAKKAWEALGVNGLGVANNPEDCNPERDLFGKAGPMLTVQQAAIIQGFPEKWHFEGRKTAAYRQVGNAFPPPVAEAVGRCIVAALEAGDAKSVNDAMKPLLPVLEESAPDNTEPADRIGDLEGAVVG